MVVADEGDFGVVEGTFGLVVADAEVGNCFGVVIADKAFWVVVAAVECVFGVANVEGAIGVTVDDVECGFGVNVADMESKCGDVADGDFEVVVHVADVEGWSDDTWEDLEGDGRWATDLGREVRGVTGSAGVPFSELMFITSGWRNFNQASYFSSYRSYLSSYRVVNYHQSQFDPDLKCVCVCV